MRFDDSHKTDAQVWHEFKLGSKEAYSFIYTKYASILYNYGYKIIQDPALVEDCIQDLFVHLLTSRQNLSSTDSIKYYLFKSLRREIIGKLRLTQPLSIGDELPLHPDFQMVLSPEAVLVEQQISQERHESLLKELNNLPARQKEAIFLKYYNNLSYEQIASIMAIDTHSVYKTIYKAIDSLQKKMANKALLYWLALHTALFVSNF